MLSSGSWVCASDGFEGKQHLLSLLALGENPCPCRRRAPRGAAAGREVGGGAVLQLTPVVGSSAVCTHYLGRLAAVGLLTLMSWRTPRLPNYSLPVNRCIPDEESSVKVILLFLC